VGDAGSQGADAAEPLRSQELLAELVGFREDRRFLADHAVASIPLALMARRAA
jgi:hypothetical protein